MVGSSKQGQFPEMGSSEACLLQAGKHEAEPMYVANSEPAIWRWGEGQAVVARQDLISGVSNRCEAGRDMGRWCVLPREALLT
jgi:hypothetical protein